MRAGWSNRLKELLHAADPVVSHVVEAVNVLSEDVKDLKSEWQAGSVSGAGGITARDDGTVILAESTNATITGPTDDGTEVDGLTHIPPFDALLIEWLAPGSDERELKTLTARLHPRPDGGVAKDVATWVCQLYRIIRWGPEEGDFRAVPISKEARVTAAGESEGDVTFDFGSFSGYPKVGPPPQGEVIDDTTSFTLIRLWALDSDGEPATNVAWMADSATGFQLTDSDYTVTHYTILEGSEEGDPDRPQGGAAYRIGSAVTNMPEFTLNETEYVEATITFGGASTRPQGLTTTGVHRIVAQGLTPADSSITYEIRPAGSGTWLECVDGDLVGEDNSAQGGGDLSTLTKATSYDIRATLTPSASGLTTPVLTRLGVEELTVTDLTGVVTVHNIRHRVDPRTLKGNITSAEFRFLRTGERDYRDYGTELLVQNHIGDIELRVWLGDPSGEHLNRSEWMLIDVFEIEDYHTESAVIVVQGLSPIRRLRTRVPPFEVTSGNDGQREVAEYTNESITDVYDDLIDGLGGLPARYRGQGVVDTALVSKRIEDADLKDELDRLAYLAGYGVISSQGRVKAVRMMTDNGERATPVEVFQLGQYTPMGFGPGYTAVVDEFFVPYGWEDARNEGRGAFEAEVRRVNATAFTKLGGSRIETTEKLDEETARWIPSDTLAGTVARRVPNHFGNGLIVWPFRSTYRMPHLEPGDPVVVYTDDFVGRSPISDQPIRGPVAGHGVVAETFLADGGAPEEIHVWIPGFDQIVVQEGDVDRVSYLRPRILQAQVSFSDAGEVIARFQVADASSVKAVANDTAFQGKSTVRAQTAEAVDADGWVEINLGGAYSRGDNAYISALAYENTDGTGREQDLLWKLKQPWETQFVRPLIIPKAWQDEDEAVLVLQERDPQGRILNVRYKVHQGGGTYDFTDPDDGSWTDATTEVI